MSKEQTIGKDKIIFASKEDHDKPSTVVLSPEDEEEPGLILPNGEINWNCPCLGGMASGPCGLEFREAFGCFHKSAADIKGSDCFEAFKTMQQCMSKYPEVYPTLSDDGEELDVDDEEVSRKVDEKLMELDLKKGEESKTDKKS